MSIAFDEAVSNMFSNPLYSNSYLFYAHILGQCKVIISDEIPTAGVTFNLDHYELYINDKFFSSLPLEHRLGTLKHEMLHIIQNHIDRGKDLNHELFNIATDCAINQLIDKSHLPENVIDLDYIKKLIKSDSIKSMESAEYYYNLLIDVSKNANNIRGDILDDHSKWQESDGDSTLHKDIAKQMAEKSIEQTQKSKGTIPHQISEWLSILNTKAQLNWKTLLRNITGNKRVNKRKTLLRQDRRLPHFEHIKGKTKDRKFDVLIIADVSGSVSNRELSSAISEIRHICDITQSDVTMIQVDTEPYPPEKVTKYTKTITRKAAGGTELYPAIGKAKECRIQYDCVIVLTDGELWREDIKKFNSLCTKLFWLITADGTLPKSKFPAFKLK